jgi:ribosomal protein S18 acetylase RimI-like enzyme
MIDRMESTLPPTASSIRPASRADVEACVSLWVAACAARDGQAFAGVAERARPKFDRSVGWFVAEHDGTLDGFVLATGPGSGLPSDPPDAAVLGLLVTSPAAQGRGLARALIRHVTEHLVGLGHPRVVLHALLDNAAALRLYESEGWEAVGEPFEHSLLGRPMRTYGLDLG